MKAVQLALDAFLNRLAGKSVVLMSDNCHGGGVSSKAGGHGVLGHVQHGSGGRPVVGATLGSHLGSLHSGEEECPSGPVKVAPTRSFLRSVPFFPGCSTPSATSSDVLMWTCSLLRPIWTTYLHLSGSGSHGVEAGRILPPMGWSVSLHLSPHRSSSPGLVKSSAFDEPFLDSRRSVLASERLVCRSSWTSGGRTFWAPLAVEPARPASCQEALSGIGDLASSRLEVTKRLVQKAGFLHRVADVVASDLNGSTGEVA